MRRHDYIRLLSECILHIQQLNSNLKVIEIDEGTPDALRNAVASIHAETKLFNLQVESLRQAIDLAQTISS